MTDSGHPAPNRRISARELAVTLAAGIPAPQGRPVRVAIDGMTGVGKTTLRGLVARELRDAGREVVEASGDDFHHQQAVRYRQGRRSARGYYEDAYDYHAMAAKLLVPLGPGGSREVRLRHHDLESDALLTSEPPIRLGDAVTLLVDGSFLQRPELDGLWDWVVLVEASREVSAFRQVARDGAPAEPDHPYHARYFDAYDIYVAEREPRAHADVNVTND